MRIVLTESVELGLYCLGNVYEEQMLREVMRYFYEYLYYLKDEGVLEKIVSVVFPLFKVDSRLVADILIRALSGKSEEFIVGIYGNILRNGWKECGLENINTLSQILSHYTIHKASINIIEVFEQLETDASNLSSIERNYE